MIARTFSAIREWNKEAEMFVLINLLDESKAVRGRVEKLLEITVNRLQSYFKEDKKAHLINPFNDCAIHQSPSLFYWGMHIATKKDPELAFSLRGRSRVVSDFFNLAEYLEKHDKVHLSK